MLKILPARDYIIKQFKFSFANIFSIPLAFGLLYILTNYLGLYVLYSNIISWTFSVIMNFWMNYAFKTIYLSGMKDYGIKQFKFLSAKVVSLGISELVIFCLTTYLSIWYIYASAISLVITTLVNFRLQTMSGVIKIVEH
ncbi:MAG: GtrA family protein [Nitrososphaerota archaeon]|nr:GtrA family protein [Nitrososphaerota archaeon]